MRTPIIFLVLSCLFISCAPPVTITTSTHVTTEPVIECKPTGGGPPKTIDTVCVEGQPLCYKIRPLSGVLQSRENDFGITIASDLAGAGAEMLCFTSTRPVRSQKSSDENPSQNLWFARRNKAGLISYIQPLTVNEQIIHQGAPSYTPDGQWIFFSAKNRPDSLGDCDIYASKIIKQGEEYILQPPLLLPVINSKYFDSQPSISPDGATLYFASDRPGGFGNTDIWYSARQSDGTWTPPKNLGAPINTTCNELTPFICADNKTLYFASDGFNSLGGFDIFTSVKQDDGTWSPPINIGAPLNTAADELFPSTPPNVRADSIFYFSSDRAGTTGGYDLYSISPNPQPPSLITMRGNVKSIRTKDPISNAKLFWKDRTTQELVATVESNEKGQFFIALTKGHQYEVGAQAEHYFYDTYFIDAPKTPGVREFTHDFFLAETLALRINFPFNDYQNPYEFVLDENGNPTTTAWQQSLEFVALNLSSFKDKVDQVILAGHTDMVGSDEYNKTLSERRAEFVKNILMNNYKIPSPMIKVIGRGKSELLSRRSSETDDIYNTRCRRVELTKIIRKEGGIK